MSLLALDTATASLCLYVQSESESRSLAVQAGLKHSERLMPAIRTLLGDSGVAVQDLDTIVCSIGPGSFTGIRIGLATAKGLAAGIRARGGACRLIGVPTLDGLAHRFRSFPGTVVAVNPSLRRKHYAALYREGRRQGEYLEILLPELAASLGGGAPLMLTGEAACALYEMYTESAGGPKDRIFVDESGLSADIAGLAACGMAREGGEEADPEPLYLRKSEAEITFFGG